MIPADVADLVREHDLSLGEEFLHSDLESSHCRCHPLTRTAALAPSLSLSGTVLSAPPRPSGDACFVCGGITVRTGTCTTCTSCGTTGGCG